jgi:hypothetical protein
VGCPIPRIVLVLVLVLVIDSWGGVAAFVHGCCPLAHWRRASDQRGSKIDNEHENEHEDDGGNTLRRSASST